MEIGAMTVEQFRALPAREDWSEEQDFDCLVILPTEEMHDSGYRCLDVVGVRNGEAVCRLAGGSDVIHIDGIGGFGTGRMRRDPSVVQGHWSIDCLPTSGLFRIWTDGGNSRGKVRAGAALSSFEIFAVAVPAKERR